MTNIHKNQISAQVVLKAEAAGNALQVAEELERAGFSVNAGLANNFSISAPAARFELFFKVRLDLTEGVRVRGATGEAAFELPLAALPEELQKNIAAILFTRHPDFGPGSF